MRNQKIISELFYYAKDPKSFFVCRHVRRIFHRVVACCSCEILIKYIIVIRFVLFLFNYSSCTCNATIKNKILEPATLCCSTCCFDVRGSALRGCFRVRQVQRVEGCFDDRIRSSQEVQFGFLERKLGPPPQTGLLTFFCTNSCKHCRLNVKYQVSMNKILFLVSLDFH